MRLVEAGQARTPAAPVTTGDCRTERGGLFPLVGPGLTGADCPKSRHATFVEVNVISRDDLRPGRWKVWAFAARSEGASRRAASAFGSP